MSDTSHEITAQVVGPVTSDVARHLGEKGITTLEQNAFVHAIGAPLTESTYVLVVDPESNQAEGYVSGSPDSLGLVISPKVAAEIGLDDPATALEQARKATHPKTDFKPVDMKSVNQSLSINLGLGSEHKLL